MKLLVTGFKGMLGSAILRTKNKYSIVKVDFPTDLRDFEQVKKCFSNLQPDYVIHTAAKVGGVKINSEHLGEFYLDNILINTNILEASRIHKVKKVLSLLSTCVYPDKVNYPLTEDQIHNGFPHSSNYSYAFAKRMLDVQSKAYRDQYGCNFITATPNNLYGINDNFDLESSHVIPAIIRKIYEAKLNNTNAIMWGDGTSLREFTYVNNIAEILLLLLEEYNDRDTINIGCESEYSIKYIAELIAKYLNFTGDLIWNTNMPSGQFRKPSSNLKFKQFLKQFNKEFIYTSLEEGLQNVCKWFTKTYPNIRGY